MGPNVLFMWESRKGLTGMWFNRLLKDILVNDEDYQEGTISTHSFRQGRARKMTRARYTDEEVKRAGRWHSRAFAGYCKLR